MTSSAYLCYRSAGSLGIDRRPPTPFNRVLNTIWTGSAKWSVLTPTSILQRASTIRPRTTTTSLENTGKINGVPYGCARRRGLHGDWR